MAWRTAATRFAVRTQFEVPLPQLRAPVNIRFADDRRFRNLWVPHQSIFALGWPDAVARTFD